jgi:mono/diheme cytochrome c family protein
MTAKHLLILALAAFSSTACRVERDPNYEWLPWINYMFFSQAAESQAPSPVNAEGKPVFTNGQAMQVPPKGTIPRGYEPLHFAKDDAGRELAGKQLKNPQEASVPNLERGKVAFTTFCAPCHGLGGAGDGPVSKRGIAGFPIHQKDGNAGEKMPDGHLFHIISYGRNNMPSYASQVAPADRWNIILYLRQLQADNAKVQTSQK